MTHSGLTLQDPLKLVARLVQDPQRLLGLGKGGPGNSRTPATSRTKSRPPVVQEPLAPPTYIVSYDLRRLSKAQLGGGTSFFFTPALSVGWWV